MTDYDWLEAGEPLDRERVRALFEIGNALKRLGLVVGEAAPNGLTLRVCDTLDRLGDRIVEAAEIVAGARK